METISAIQQEVENIRTSEVSEAEMNSAKETALNSFVFTYDTKSKTLSRVLTYEYYGYPKDFIQQYQKALDAVTARMCCAWPGSIWIRSTSPLWRWAIPNCSGTPGILGRAGYPYRPHHCRT